MRDRIMVARHLIPAVLVVPVGLQSLRDPGSGNWIHPEVVSNAEDRIPSFEEGVT